MEVETTHQHSAYISIPAEKVVAGRDSYLPLKRALDLVLAGVALVLLSPLMALIALGIKLYSPGPVLFRQQRVGKDGAEFSCLKFRSMKQDTDSSLHRRHTRQLIRQNTRPDQTGPQSLKLQHDPRITGIGAILRRASLDELPQLFNVLRGEMSLIGPRPPIPYEVEVYQEWHHRRFDVLPGITGLWQVQGRNQVSFDEMVRMDIDYIERMSLALDLWILMMTPIAVLKGKGAG